MKFLLTVILVLFFLCSFSQRTDRRLQKKVHELIDSFHGQIGVYVHDLQKNKVVAINADSVFPTASMVKIPILVGVMDKINRGELSYHQELVYKDSLLYAGSDILGSLKNNEKIGLNKVMMLMLTTSDNTASLWLQSLAGKGTRINEILDSLGFKNTRVNSRTPGRESNRSVYGWGQTSPREMATLMEMIVNRQVISDSISARMLRLLGRNFWDENAISQVPPDVFVASKNGAVDASRSEVLFVNGHGRRYIFCICTNNNRDQSWRTNNEAWEITRKLSRMFWEWYK
jgi:beta-lactamase class A